MPNKVAETKAAAAAILNLHERIENKLFLDRTRKDSNFKRPHIYEILFQIEKCWPQVAFQERHRGCRRPRVPQRIPSRLQLRRGGGVRGRLRAAGGSRPPRVQKV